MSTSNEQASFELAGSEEETRTLSLVDVWVINVPPKQASTFMTATSTKLPLPIELSHVKRIKKTQDENGTTLHAILCVADSDEFDKDRISQLLGDGFSLDAFTPTKVGVPRYPPVTREQHAAWMAAWPVSYHQSRESEKKRPEEFAVDEIRRVKAFMREAVEEARKARDEGNAYVGCVIVDPVNGVIVARAGDATRGHPLGFAVMEAIGSVARGLVVDSADGEASRKRKGGGDGAYLCKGLDVYVTHEPNVM